MFDESEERLPVDDEDDEFYGDPVMTLVSRPHHRQEDK